MKKTLLNFFKILFKVLRPLLIFLVALSITTTYVVKTSGDPEFNPPLLVLDNTPIKSTYFLKEKQELLDYLRPEEQTILTIPEWYLVYNPKEYADFLEGSNNPSNFPWMKSINEYWSLYDRAVITSARYNVDNDDYILMLNVIGISTTAEFILKGLYENTVGRLTRWAANNDDTPEDLIIKKAHRAYSDKLDDDVWYVFDFKSWVKAIWGETQLFGDNFIRRTERKLFFTMEFGFKHFYAKLIAYGAEAKADEKHSGQIYFETEQILNTTNTPLQLPSSISIIKKKNNRALLSSSRWGEFTRSIPKLLKKGVKLNNISANDYISVSYITKSNNNPIHHPSSTHLFSSKVVTNNTLVRYISLVKIINLGEFLSLLEKSPATLEHIYDY